MTVGLFIPCYVDQFYPQVGRATLSVLEKLGFAVQYPLDQTCCGQPLANSGFEGETAGISAAFRDNFSRFDQVVCPSGSCVLHAKDHVAQADADSSAADFSDRFFEFSHFVSKHAADLVFASYPRTVAVHQSCHGLRGLRLGSASELMNPQYSVVHDLLARIPDITIASLDRADECCGFGGTFAVKEEAISTRMGHDRLDDQTRNGAEVVTGTDVSCLMHLEGLSRRQGRPLEFRHVSEILDEVMV